MHQHNETEQAGRAPKMMTGFRPMRSESLPICSTVANCASANKLSIRPA